MIAYKLFHVRRDGSLGPLFVNRSQRLNIGVSYASEDHPTKGYAHRPGWHCCIQPLAPHLSLKNRVWARVNVSDYEIYSRPVHQGGQWVLARSMTILNKLSIEDVEKILSNMDQ